MKQCATRGYEQDPFLMKSSRTLERSILEATKLVPDHVLPAGPLPLPIDHDSPQLRYTGRNEANKATRHNNRVLRFTMAGIGALLLVVPMLIMANIPGKTASLITTCIALLIFSVLIPLLTELGPNEILATTAAYAAVLVVFVGTSLTTNAVVVAPTT
jgi:VIT1/CCC1 family predicted Fe2+/Mn2+ transporter